MGIFGCSERENGLRLNGRHTRGYLLRLKEAEGMINLKPEFVRDVDQGPHAGGSLFKPKSHTSERLTISFNVLSTTVNLARLFTEVVRPRSATHSSTMGLDLLRAMQTARRLSESSASHETVDRVRQFSQSFDLEHDRFLDGELLALIEIHRPHLRTKLEEGVSFLNITDISHGSISTPAVIEANLNRVSIVNLGHLSRFGIVVHTNQSLLGFRTAGKANNPWGRPFPRWLKESVNA
ncbi:hypothetical protein C8R45DRAFT_934158 [Mycena sanguinolenta]|nr:hypothetical protein C8R45DRAFT_934158 [Mycena sanguinolenta]